MEVFKVTTTQELISADASTSGIEAGASTNHELNDSHQLIELDSEPLSVGLIEFDENSSQVRISL